MNRISWKEAMKNFSLPFSVRTINLSFKYENRAILIPSGTDTFCLISQDWAENRNSVY
jgi:hypothetical protein